MQFAEDEAWDNKRAADETGGAKVRNPAIDDDAGVEHKRLMFHCLAGKTDIRDNERELVAIAAHGQHHAEIGEGGVYNQPYYPLRRFGLEAQHFRGCKQIGKNKPEQESERRRRKSAQGNSLQQPINQDDDQSGQQTDEQTWHGTILQFARNERADRAAERDKKHPQQIDRE